MGLFSALTSAVSGLRVNQRQVDLTSRNVANQGTVGYTRRVLVTQELNSNPTRSSALREVEVRRTLDLLVQKQLRVETSGASFAEVKADFHTRLDQLFGSLDSDSGLDAQFSDFSRSLQQLAADPASTGLRGDVLNQGALLASRLNEMSSRVQALRQEAEVRIGDDVKRLNQALKAIEVVQRRIVGTTDSGALAALYDERDRQVGILSEVADVRVLDNGKQGFSIYTTLGAPLMVDATASQVVFDERGSLNADAVYSNNPAVRGVGTLRLVNPSLGSIDLIESGLIRSGSIAALLELRDETLVQAQNQLDEAAAKLSRALSDRTQQGVAATVGLQQGFDIDLAGLQQGNEITLDYLEQPGNVARRFTFIRVDNPASLPLPPQATPDPNDTVVGINFSGGTAAAAAAIQTALGAAFTVSNPAGTTIRILDDGGAGTRDITGLSAQITNTALVNQGPELPFFGDGSNGFQLYTGSFENGTQKRGYAAGITVNPALLADRSRLVAYSTAPPTTSGDNTRPKLLYDRLESTNTAFAPETGIGETNAPFVSTVNAFARRIVERQGQEAADLKSLEEGQKVVVNALRERFAEGAGVDVDTELAELVQIQTTYAANARVVAAVRDLFDTLLRI